MPAQYPPISTENTYVFSARSLDEDIRASASCGGVFYVEEIRELDENEVLVRVASLLNRLCDKTRSYVMIFSRDLFHQALILDRELQKLPTCELREKVDAHAAEARGELSQESVASDANLAPSLPGLQPVLIDVPEEALQKAVDTMEVSESILAAAQHRYPRLWGRLRRWIELALFRATLFALERQKELQHAIRCLLVSRRCGQRLIRVHDVLQTDRQVTWLVRVEFPHPSSF
jgi:hypothetical protein